MKKNRKKKNKGTSPANDKSGFLPLRVRFKDLLRSNAAAFQTLRDAVAICGTVKKGNGAIFYGNELLEELVAGTYDEPGIKTIAMVPLDADTFEEQAETLRKIVEELKGVGTCCYGCGSAADERDPCYVFVQNGVILKKEEQGEKGAIVALSRKMAMKFVATMKADLDMPFSILNVGAVYNSTLSELLDKWCKAGDDCAFVVQKIEEEAIDYRVVYPRGQSDAE